MDWISLLQFVIGTVLILVGAELFTERLIDLAKRWRLSLFFSALVVAGAEPEEFLAAAIAAWKGSAELALGTALGTNLTIITLVIGLAVLIYPKMGSEPASFRRGMMTFGFTLIPYLLMFNGTLARWEGWLLMALFFVYMLYMMKQENMAWEVEGVVIREGKIVESEAGEETTNRKKTADDFHDENSSRGKAGDKDKVHGVSNGWLLGLLIVAGIAMMGYGGNVLVESTVALAADWGISESAMGLVFVSLATSAETLAMAFVPLIKGRPEITYGSIIGSYAYNLFLSLGIAAAVLPLPISWNILDVFMPLMLIILLLFTALYKAKKVPRVVGLVFIVLYGLYVWLAFR